MNTQFELEPSLERLIYIRAMLNELRKMASDEHAHMLTYLIEMAYIEASDAMEEKKAGPDSAAGLSQPGNSAA